MKMNWKDRAFALWVAVVIIATSPIWVPLGSAALIGYLAWIQITEGGLFL